MLDLLSPIEAYVDQCLVKHERKSTLRFITCGSVDDGKSTLIGRLLFECHKILDDQLDLLKADSKRIGTQGGALDFALLVDGLQAEREQGITIDVAYRYFSTERRQFVVADAPGHEQYTRNMVTGASNADLAVVLVDARHGALVQTRRHTYLAWLMGIPQVILVVNKLDLLDYDESPFRTIEEQYGNFARELGVGHVTCIPVSALHGDNLTQRSPRTPWYRGPTLLQSLEDAPVQEEELGPLRFPVQCVTRPNPEFRGISGTVARGIVRPGDRVVIAPSGTETTVNRIVTADGDLPEARAGQAVTLTLWDAVDVSRGDVLCAAGNLASVSDQVEAHVIWMHEAPMLAGRRYVMKIGHNAVNATLARPKYQVNVNTLGRAAATTLGLNEIGVCNISLDRPIAFDPYRESRDLGGFILIDRFSDETVGAGMIAFGLRRAQNLHWQEVEVDTAAHAALNGHQPAVVWLTGLSGAGKSTIANLLEKRLHAQGIHTFLLDGDNIRYTLNRDLGFTDADRVENVRRLGEVARLMAQAGLVVIAACISPFMAERRMVRDFMEPGTFCEVLVHAPIEVAEARDPKGLYAKARRGELRNFTGVDSPYEPPSDPEIRIDTVTMTAAEAVDRIMARLEETGVLPGLGMRA